MKKLLILSLLFLSCSFSNPSNYYATTWSATASNQMVTRQALNNAVANGVFTAKQSFPNDLRCVTKEMAQAYVNIATIYGYSANQLVPKSTFTSAVSFYPHTVNTLFWGDGTGGTTSSANALAYLTTVTGCIYSQDLYSYYARSLDVGDEIFHGANNTYYPALNTGSGSACATSYGSGWWIHDPSQNCALEITNSNTGRQYVITKVFPSGTSPFNICIDANYTSSSTMTFQAVAHSAVNTNVICYYQFKINGGFWQYGNVTISSGQITSNQNSYNNGSTINDIEISVYDFSPSLSGSQNYVYTGQCF